MELILWRHAEAEDGLPDIERALTAKGHKQAEKMSAWLNAHLPPHTHILVSPAKRTQQTAHALGRDFTTLDILAPGASEKDILQAAGWPEDTESVLIVGHQPTLGGAAALALTGKPGLLGIKKGAIWWISHRERDGSFETYLKVVLGPELL